MNDRLDGVAQAAKDADIYRLTRNAAPLYAKYTNFKGFPVKINV